ncbi:hypothetical protein AWI43_33265 [Streptomyces sp. WAC04657]|nr:hypothetical protein AWI43_33265 [Streptomyces sp. WAC04657]
MSGYPVASFTGCGWARSSWTLLISVEMTSRNFLKAPAALPFHSLSSASTLSSHRFTIGTHFASQA